MPWLKIQHYFDTYYFFTKKTLSKLFFLLLCYLFPQSKFPKRTGWQAKGNTPVRVDQMPSLLNSQFFFEYKKDRYGYKGKLQHRPIAVKLDELPINGTLSLPWDKRICYFISSPTNQYSTISTPYNRTKGQSTIFRTQNLSKNGHSMLLTSRRFMPLINYNTCPQELYMPEICMCPRLNCARDYILPKNYMRLRLHYSQELHCFLIAFVLKDCMFPRIM